MHSISFELLSEIESEVPWSCWILCDPVDCSPPRSSVHGTCQVRIVDLGGHFLLQGIFLTQEMNLGLPHFRQILYRLSYKGLKGKKVKSTVENSGQ